MQKRRKSIGSVLSSLTVQVYSFLPHPRNSCVGSRSAWGERTRNSGYMSW